MNILRIPLVIVLIVAAGRTFTASAQTVTEMTLHSFLGYPTDGSDPVAGLVQGTNGNFYGATPYGGIDDIGIVFRISPGGSYTDFYSFGSSGAESYAGLVRGSNGDFYGTTTLGGTTFHGTVFRISPSGAYTNLHSFAGPPTDGANPYAGLAQGSDGNFYGTTTLGGPSTNCSGGCGTVFRISPSGTYTTLYAFEDALVSPTDGSEPFAGLVQGSDGNFYGTTKLGGMNYAGTVFRISPSGTETTLHSFPSFPNDGTEPYAGLVQGSDGNFYGTTEAGGTYNYGTVFQISPSGAYTTLYSFAGSPNDGSYPQAGLVQGSDDNFYGTTVNGGPSTNFDAATGDYGYGTVFRISPSGTYTNLYSFPGSPNDGVNPAAGLIQGSDGNFYGTTQGGGMSTNFNPDTGDTGYGTVFKLDVGLGPISTNCAFSINQTNAVFDAAGGSNSVSVTASNGCSWTATSNAGFITITSGISGFGDGTVSYSVEANTSTTPLTGTMTIAGQTYTITQAAAPITETVLYSFAGPPTDGEVPLAGVVQGSDGYFYGTTSEGGNPGNYGTVFLVSPNGGEFTLYSFVDYANDGLFPYAGLVQGSDGNFYGTTHNGGFNGGTVFRIGPSGGETILYSFAGSPNDGASPEAGLVQGSDSNFYGTTTLGGTTFHGTVFRISPGGGETILHSFAGSPTDGANPYAGLVQGSDSNFYGTTFDGGTSGSGTVFRISPSGSETNLYSFGGSAHDGASPEAGLIQGSDSNFYGTTLEGGAHDDGTVFRISPSGSETILHSFAGPPTDGANPYAGLVQGSDGNFYGTTYLGGTSTNCSGGCGTAFRISPSGSYASLYSFVGYPTDGSAPVAGLVQGSDSNFYGTTEYGGANDVGSVFKLDVGLGPISTNCTFSINHTNAVFDAAGGSDSVSVTASNGCDWLATNNDGFITITTDSSGSGNGPVRYTVAPNTSTNDLTGTMTIAGQTFTVTESGTTSSGGGCTYTLSATNVILAAKGGSKTVSVKVKGTDCAWTAVSNDPFITITSGSSYTGASKVDYSVPGNTNTTALSGTMTIAGETYTVNQAAGGCTYKISPKDGKIKSTGGTATIKVTPNLSDCTWVAGSGSDFITIVSGASGTGKGTVTYSVLTNATSNVLTGSISVAGETFTVIQAGVK